MSEAWKPKVGEKARMDVNVIIKGETDDGRVTVETEDGEIWSVPIVTVHSASKELREVQAVEFGVEYALKYWTEREEWPKSYDAGFPGIKAQALMDWAARKRKA